jgi:hypothetical protein
MERQPENSTPTNDLTIKYRIKLPSPPIISKEEDEKFLYKYMIENFEEAKAAMLLPNVNEYAIAKFNSYDSGLSLTYLLCFNLFLYRRFRIKNQLTRSRSFLKSLLFTSPFYFLWPGMLGYSLIQIENSLYNDLFNGGTEETITKYKEFKKKYESLTSKKLENRI